MMCFSLNTIGCMSGAMYDVVYADGTEQTMSREDILGMGTQGIVLYFYPKDNTPGCTMEAVDFSALRDDFDALGYAVVGVSKDSVDSHHRFCQKHSLSFPLISDTSLVLHHQFSTLGEKKMFGKVYEGVIRSTFILNSEGVIVHERRHVRAKNHAQSVYEFLAL